MFRVGLKLAFVAMLLYAVIGLGFYVWALTFDLNVIRDIPQRSVVYDRNGNFYSRLSGENRVVVPFDKISNDFVNALLTREDRRFYSHHGIDPIGILRAIVRNFIAGGFREGASTITQQLARNSFSLGGKTLRRKLIEAALAYRIETELTKEEILEAYMNRIYFGSGYYGIETASRAYFQKPASRLNLPESALLAGLIRSPNRFSPFNNLSKSLHERDVVLRHMRQLNFITEDEMNAALAVKPTIPPKPHSAPEENWAMDAILHEVGLVIDRNPFEGGGLQIYTTIDGDLQNAAQTAVRQHLKQIESWPAYPHKPMTAFSARDVAGADAIPYLEAAVIVIDNKTGGILAIVGSRDYDRSKFNRALLGNRQIGSTVKPFVYARAFEAGLKATDLVSDNRLTPDDLPDAYKHYDPANADHHYRGDLPAAEGLIHSRNTMTVRIGVRAGLSSIADLITRTGLSTHPPRGPALCLGAFDANLKNLTASYTAFATGGTKLQPFLIERITDADGHLLYKATHGKLRVITPKAARLTTKLMEQVLTRGTGAKAHAYGLRHRAAGKTGTTENAHDAWFVGFDDRITCGVWVGFDLPKKIMPGGSGSQLALPIWVDIVEAGR